MSTYYVTFGQKYRHEPHPQGGHPDGWVEIHARTEDQARELAFKYMGNNWGFMYSNPLDTNMYPLGCLKIIEDV